MAVKKSSEIKLDKKDVFRALLTDTAPNDVPIIFNNDGLYINSHRVTKEDNSKLYGVVLDLHSNIVNILGNKQITDLASKNKYQKKFSSPFKYKILKNEVSLRTLSLVHPRAQYNFCNFYKEQNPNINYLCSQSSFSIRSPVKVGNSFSLGSDKKVINKNYKEINIDTLETELYKKAASSYFTYKGYDRIYKLYNSNRFYELEKKYSNMWFLDVANCFDSIYTHTISWAVKNKEFIKKNVKQTNQFCHSFDTLMQRSNNNETNGICIGSEVSRVFAETIFQSIDVNVEIKLKTKYSLNYDEDYTVLRYVDDYVVFAKSEKTTEKVTNTISDCLNEYNLYLGENKLIKYKRPFCTEKSAVVVGMNSILLDFENSIFETSHIGNTKRVIPKKIYRKSRFSHSFIDKIKKLCIEHDCDYSYVSAYIIAVLYRRIKELVKSDPERRRIVSAKDLTPEEKVDMLKEGDFLLRDSFEILLELTFFYYSVHPSVSASNRVAQSIISVDNFLDEKLAHYLPYTRSLIMGNINNLSFELVSNDTREGFISLERLNILLATSEFGEHYLLPEKKLNEMVSGTKQLTYFDIISLLYYCKNHPIYENIVKEIEKISLTKLKSNFNLLESSEHAHLLLDLLSCPYISICSRKELLKLFYIKSFETNTKNDSEIEVLVTELEKTYWFVKWKGLDLYKLLARKELKSVY
jgi:hypothetical protein